MTSKRTISAANEAATLASHVKLIVFARLDFPSGVKRFHTEIGPRTATHPVYGAESYIGVGDFGGIEGEVTETLSGAPATLGLVLTGLDTTLINTALTEDYFRRSAELMLGLEDSTGNLVDDPVVLFSGYMDKIDIAMNPGESGIRLSLESRATNLLRSSDWRVTDEDLQAENPGDLLFEYVYQMADLVLRWGRHTPQYGGGGRREEGKFYLR